MVRLGRLVAVLLASASVLALGEAPAQAARACGAVGRPFTDGTALVTVRKGSLKCSTARGLMKAYWSTEVEAFASTVRLRHAGIRWTCRPTTDDFPYRWSCGGGGESRDRFRVTARE